MRLAALLCTGLLGSLWICGPSAPELKTLPPEQWPGRLADLRGRPALVYVWAPWCRECVETLPPIVSLSVPAQQRGLRLVTVCLDDPGGGSFEQALALVRRAGARNPNFLLESDLEESLSLFGVRELPAALVFTSNGELRYQLEPDGEGRPLSQADVADAIDAVLPPP